MTTKKKKVIKKKKDNSSSYACGLGGSETIQEARKIFKSWQFARKYIEEEADGLSARGRSWGWILEFKGEDLVHVHRFGPPSLPECTWVTDDPL